MTRFDRGLRIADLGFQMYRSLENPTWVRPILGVLGMISGLGWLTYIYPPFGFRLFMVVALFRPYKLCRKDLLADRVRIG